MRVWGGIAAIILAMLAFCLVPSAAVAQTTPDPTATIDASATQTPTPAPDPTATPSPTESPSQTPTPTTDPSPSDDPTPSATQTGHRPHGGLFSLQPAALNANAPKKHHDGRSRHRHDRSWKPDPRWGAYSTVRLVEAWRRLKRKGESARTAVRRAYAPFPVAGLAVWSDTWGAPRYAGGYHPHHGQDLLCAEGTPLLAVTNGTVHLGSDPLGGTTIQLTLRDGSFWYYAHLAHYAKGLTEGDRVHTGEVIGACGETGDATVPHLHFSFFTARMDARNPMHALLGWLHQAEHRVGAKPSNGHGVPTPPDAELAVPPVMHPRPETATAPWSPPPPSVETSSSHEAGAPMYGAIALLVPVGVFAASKRVRSRLLRRGA
jgi:murein DD-endopeptidase MepM/ murein hydrolase activator NlpD